MANSTLIPQAEQAPVVDKGHGTGALGPSDSSDSGSDIRGGPGLEDTFEHRGLRRSRSNSAGAGRDVGDENLDSDTDSNGTGERAAAGRDFDPLAHLDIGPDHIEHIGEIAADENEPIELGLPDIDEEERALLNPDVDTLSTQKTNEPKGAAKKIKAR